MSKREELRKRRQQQTRRGQMTMLGGTVALAVTGYLIYQNTRPIGEITLVEKESFLFADGKALGPADDRVVIQEFSDFQ